MKESYLTHFSLREPPFSKEVPDADLWAAVVETGRRRRALRRRRGTRQHPAHRRPWRRKDLCPTRSAQAPARGGFRLTYCHNVTLGRRDFYRQLCIALGLSPSATAAAVFHAVSTHVQDLGRDRVHPVFLLDESHLLHQDTLDHLHILLNYEWDSRPLLSLILVGLPELRHRLQLRRNRSLYSRLHRRVHIDVLRPEDTAEYIRMRLHRAACDRDLFTSDALAMIHEAATGGMRDIDRLATAALREAARRKKKLVERDVLARVVDLDQIVGAA
jgi:general secretion pathway protein A